MLDSGTIPHHSKVFRHLIIAALIGVTTVQPVMQAASSLPSGGAFTAGNGKITSAGNTMTINQSSLRGIIDWNTFSIGTDATVNFRNGAGATLNFVNGGAATAILGRLLASGNIYLINPQGVLIGHGAAVHTGGDFLVSTLNVSNSAFLSGGALLFSGASPATVVNLGSLNSSGGSIFLIGRSVQNSGSITAANGTTGLAAGNDVLITDSSNNQKVAVEAPGGDVTNFGFISAAQVELKSNGGNIYALAGNSGGQINATGTATQNGHVWLIAANGNANVASSITASNADGTGGDIETSGAHVTTAGAKITTGKGGNWLLDPDDLLINSTLAGTIESSLNGGTNVTEQTGNGNSGNGDITVASNIAWTTGADLTLSAYRNIGVSNGVTISNTGAGNLTLRADNTSNGTGNIIFTGTGKIDFSNSTGNVALLYNPPGGYATPNVYTSNVLTNSSWVAPADGSVTSQLTAYMLVNSAANLQSLDTNDAGIYALGQNIDLSSISNFSPLGMTNPYFTGILDGMGHTISNLTVTAASDLGLFSDVGVGGQVRNLNLTGINITASSTSQLIGGLAGELDGTASNVSVAGTIHAGEGPTALGGLAGYLDGTIQNSTTNVTIDASGTFNGAAIGGLVGYSDTNFFIANSSAAGSINAPFVYGGNVGGLVGANAAIISNSSATGVVIGGSNSSVGGLIGQNYYGSVTSSFATGPVTGNGGTYLGGLIGTSSAPTINSYATGAVTGNGAANAGGLVGYNSMNSPISGSYATGNVNNTGSNTGGLVGSSQSSISNSYATGNVLGQNNSTYVGGLVGQTSADVSGSYATGAVSGSITYLGGLIGYSSAAGATISNSYASGSVTMTYNGYSVGGLVGYNVASVINSHATGVVTDSGGADYIGGLTGWTDGSISGSYATGSVSSTGNALVGGLSGGSDAPTLNSYATGAVSVPDGAQAVGGLVGATYTGGTITGSYATGSVTGGANVLTGGLVGVNEDSIANSYATGTVSGGQNVGGLSGENDNSSITTSWASGTVTGPAGALVGGLVGRNRGSSITTSYALGNVIGAATSYVGGLVGDDNAGSIADTYSRGNVTGGTGAWAGGLVGWVENGTVTRSYSSGAVTGSGSNVGGLMGENDATVSYSYWDNQTSGFPSIGIGNNTGTTSSVSGLTTAQLQSGNMPTGFNANNTVWIAPANVYPYFGWQGSLVTISGTAYNGTSVIPSAGVGILSNGVVLGNPVTNAVGFYTLGEPSNMVNANSGVLAYLTTNGTANTFATGPNFTNLDLHVGTLNILGGNSPTLSDITAALAATLGGNNGSNFLFTLPNGLLNVNTAATLSLATTGSAFTIDQPLTGGNMQIAAAGNLDIATTGSVTASAAGNITLSTGQAFNNAGGGSALTTTGGGQWSIYSQNPANDALDGLTPVFKQYNATYGVTTPAQSGDGLFYTLAPVITASLIGTTSKVYDGTTAATLGAGNITAAGAIQGDTVSVSAGSAAYTNSNVNTGIGITASNLNVTASNGNIPVYGYQIASSPVNGAIGTITPATLTYIAGPATQSTGSSNTSFTGTVTGFVDGQTVASSTTGAATFTSATSTSTPSGTYAIHGSGLTADNGNYTFVQAAGNSTALTITAAAAPPNPTPTPAPAPTPTPTPAPVAAPTTITIDINSLISLNGQTAPTFSASYYGPAINGLNIAGLLAGLTYRISPALDGPGTYTVTAYGVAPDGYTFVIRPGTFTLVDNSAKTLPTQANIYTPPVPYPFLASEPSDTVSPLLAPVNALGAFQVRAVSTGNAFGSSFAGFNSQEPPLSQSSFFGGANDKPQTYAAGAKP